MSEKGTSSKDRIAEARKRAEKTRKDREEKQGKLTAKDDLISQAGNFLASNKAALEAWTKFFEGPIELLDRHLKSISAFRRQNRDQYARIMTTFDQCDDYSSDEWEIEQEKHQEHLEFLQELKRQFEEDWKDEGKDTDSGRADDSDASDGSDRPVGGGVRGRDEKRGSEGDAEGAPETPEQA